MTTRHAATILLLLVSASSLACAMNRMQTPKQLEAGEVAASAAVDLTAAHPLSRDGAWMENKTARINAQATYGLGGKGDMRVHAGGAGYIEKSNGERTTELADVHAGVGGRLYLSDHLMWSASLTAYSLAPRKLSDLGDAYALIPSTRLTLRKPDDTFIPYGGLEISSVFAGDGETDEDYNPEGETFPYRITHAGLFAGLSRSIDAHSAFQAELVIRPLAMTFDEFDSKLFVESFEATYQLGVSYTRFF